MLKFKTRQTGLDLHQSPLYNSYLEGKYNAFFPEYAPKSVGGTFSASDIINKESKGNCTWYVFGRYQEVFGVRLPFEKRQLHAGNWAVDSQTPQIGSIVVFTDSQYGHVAFVEDIVNGKVILSESSYSTRGNDFLHIYGRSVDEVCRVWGMRIKGYINPAEPCVSYNEDLPVLDYKVGDLLEISTIYENHHLESTKSVSKVNHLGRGAVYVIKLYPKDNNPYAVSYTKGGEQVGGVRGSNVYRINQADILSGMVPAPVSPAPAPKPPVTASKVGKYANIGGNTWLFKVSRTDETYHASGNGYNQLTDLRNRSARILAEDNGRVQVRIAGFNPEVIWVANSQISVTDTPKYNVD